MIVLSCPVRLIPLTAGLGISWAAIAPTTQPSPASQPPPAIAFRLSATVYPAGVESEEVYARHVQGRIDESLAKADQAPDLSAKARHLLMAANLILSRGIEPQVTRLLLEIETPRDAADLAAGVEEARKHLDAARALLLGSNSAASQPSTAPGSDSSEPDRAPPSELGRVAPAIAPEKPAVCDDLTAFAEALQEAWAGDGIALDGAAGPDVERQVSRAREAVSALATLLEDDRPGVAANARLYHAVLLSRIERVDRALTGLDLALQPLRQDAAVPSFYARLLRCRYLARQGSYAVSTALLLRLEERSHEWFDDPQLRIEAANTAALVRREVLRQWRDALTAEGKESAAAWCADAADRIDDTLRAEEDSPVVLRLGLAVPLLAEDRD